MNIKRKLITSGVAAAMFCSPSLYAQDWQGEAKDAWVDGKIESSYLLNTELNNFDIDTEVENGLVTLAGTVSSEAHKDLAGEIANNIEGINSVNNNLTVSNGDTDMSHELSEADRNFTTAFFDGTTFVGLKSEYAINGEIDANDINVAIEDGEVTLNGRVDSESAKMLAEELALNYDHVTSVDNRLEVMPEDA